MNDTRNRAALRAAMEERSRESVIWFHAIRWAPLLALALLTYLLYPVARGVDLPLLDVGKVSQREVIAPFEFQVRKSATEIDREADALAATVLPVYELRSSISDSLLVIVNGLFDSLDSATSTDSMISTADAFGIPLNVEEAEYLTNRRLRQRFRRSLTRMIGRVLARGVTGPGTIENETSRQIVVRSAAREVLVAKDSVISYRDFLELRSTYHPDSASVLGNEVYVKLLTRLFRPTLLPRRNETEVLRTQARALVDPVKETIRRDQRIINAHEVLTADVRDRLLALRQELISRGGTGEGNIRGTFAQVLTNGMLLAPFWLLLMLYRRYTYDDLRQVIVLSSLLAIVIIGAAINIRFVTDKPELIPVPFAAMLITVLFSGRVSMVGSIMLAVLLGSQAIYGGLDALYIVLIGGIAASLSVRTIRRRTQLLGAFAIVAAAFAIASLTVALRAEWSIPDLGASIVRGSVNAFASAALVTIVLPVFERFTHKTTDLTLLELSDPNHPLLRRLATEAPGTYAHSIAMANLCEAACNAIGANGLLARVGCYYHDVGKLKRPQFFVENQVTGVNPHDKMKPDVSASIIRNHVKEGLALADEYHLPETIRDFIPQHHGTLEITYFLDRARSRNSGEEVDAEQFRYPGPIPDSAETAVTMLADGVEAALRVIEEPTPEKLKGAIDHLATQRIDAGQFRNAPLTLAQLDQVKAEFLRVLTGVYHSRIDYPASSGGINAEWVSSAND